MGPSPACRTVAGAPGNAWSCCCRVIWHSRYVRPCCQTGASSGIGKATAFGFAREGANVALLARRREILKEVASAIETRLARRIELNVEREIYRLRRTGSFDADPDVAFDYVLAGLATLKLR